LNGSFDGTWSTIAAPTHVVPQVEVFTQSSTGMSETLVVPAGTQDVILDARLGNVRGGGESLLAVRALGTTTWSGAAVLLQSTDNTAQTRTDMQLSLGVVPADVPLEIKLECRTILSSGSATCTWSNLRFSTGTTPWRRAGNIGIIDGPFGGIMAQVHQDRVANIVPTTGPFFAMTVTAAGGGARYNSTVRYESPILQLPTFSSTAPLTVSVRWARTLTDTEFDPTAPLVTKGATISFAPIGSTSLSTLLTIPDGDLVTSTPWTSLQGNAYTTISGKRGRIIIQKQRGYMDHVLALDSLTFYLDGKPIAMPMDQGVGKCSCDVGGRPQVIQGDPVNTFSGAYYLQATDIAVPSAGPPLDLTRSYTSLFAASTAYPVTPLGPGWRHAFADALTLPTQPGGTAGTIIYEAHTGNRLRFYDAGNGQFDPAPGVRATLRREADGTYTLTTRSQRLQRFDAQGRLIEQRDAQGHQQTLAYYAASGTPWDGQLERVTDVATTRMLTFTYINWNNQPRLDTVRDHTGRTIRYSYTPAGDLHTVTDVRGGTTTYGYAGTTHLLTSVQRPDGVVEVTNQYNAQQRVERQDEATGLVTTYQYADTADGRTTTMTRQHRTGGPTDVLVDHYRPDGSVEYQARNGRLLRYVTYDSSMQPAVEVDAQGNATRIQNTSVGLPTKVVDATNTHATVTYTAQQRPATIVGPDGVTTTLTYDAAGNVTAQERRAGELRETTLYTYTAENRLVEQRAPDDVVTRYAYDAAGQLISQTVGHGTALAQTTSYGYGALGRVTSTTVGAGTPLQRRDETRYNDNGSVRETIHNYRDGRFDPAKPDEDVTTTYGYDPLGRQVWLRDTLGHYTATHYDGQTGRVDWTARNLDAAALTAQQQLPSTPPAFDPARPDVNVATFYHYDGLGRLEQTTDTGMVSGAFNAQSRTFSAAATRVTRTEYDSLSRPVITTLNYQPNVPSSPDVNVQLLTRYDATGNVVGRRDALGRWTVTEYDALNRPTKIIQNYENGDPRTVGDANRAWTDGSDTDLITVMHYRPDGQVERQIENVVDEQFTATEPITDRMTDYTYDDLGRLRTTTLSADPTTKGSRTDTNRTTEHAYDAKTGWLLGTQDALGRWVSYQYADLGRVTTTTQNCRASNGTSQAQGCAPLDAAQPDRNLPTTTVYDALGRVVETIDPLTYITRTTYDGLGRVTATTQNYRASTATTPTANENVTTRTTYDALGRVVARTDATNVTTSVQYDALGNGTSSTQGTRSTQAGYDGTGVQRWQRQADGRLTVFEVDGLGRIITTIQNYQNGVVDANEPVDQDLITRTRYDAAGRPVAVTNPAGRVTTYTYDLLDRLVGVQENTRADCGSATLAQEHKPCNVTTRYRYDRVGNRVAMTDARATTPDLAKTYTQTWEYDAADRQFKATDALGRPTTWEYDALGRRLVQRDPRGSTHDVTYGYDEVDRLRTITSPTLGTGIEHRYDAGGRRTDLIDATGTTKFGYDPLDRMIKATAPNTGLISYGYTARGERAWITYPDTTIRLDYQYWPDGQLRKVLQGTTLLAEYQYEADTGRLDYVTRANGTKTDYSYDRADQVRDVQTTAGTTALSRFAYEVDRLGQRTAVQETVQTTATPPPCWGQGCPLWLPLTTGRAPADATPMPSASSSPSTDPYPAPSSASTPTPTAPPSASPSATPTPSVTKRMTYGYDALQRLTNVVTPDGMTYGYDYDQVGNRTSVSVAHPAGGGAYADGTQYDAANQVKGWQYDGVGNLLHDGTTTYTYDALNRLTNHAQDSTTITHAYNGDGVLVSDAVSGGTPTRYTQDLAAALPQVLQVSGGATTTYLYGLDRLAEVRGGQRTWEVHDALGSVRQMLNDQGGAFATQQYDAWGVPSNRSASTPFGFTGELHDARSGLVYLRARWYDADDARFLTYRWRTDEVEDTLPYTHHPYAYALSNPVNLTDPTGKCASWVLGPYNPDPSCQFIGWERARQGDLNYADAVPWVGAGIDVIPGIGDVKGLIEVFTGCDIVTGEDLGHWRWAGLLFVAELRHARHLDGVDDALRSGDNIFPPSGPGSGADVGRTAPSIPWSSGTVRRAAEGLAQGATSVNVSSRSEAEELFLRLYQGDTRGYRNTTGMSPTEAKDFYGGKAGTYHWDEQVGTDGRLAGHAPGSSDAQFRHLQIHTHDGNVIRIFFGGPLTWP